MYLQSDACGQIWCEHSSGNLDAADEIGVDATARMGEAVSIATFLLSHIRPGASHSPVLHSSNVDDLMTQPIASTARAADLEGTAAPNHAIQFAAKSIPPTPPPPASPSTPFHHWPTTYPHIAERIISHLPNPARLALRASSRAFYHAVDAVYVRNLTLTPFGPLTPSGRPAYIHLASRPDLWPHVRLLDLTPLTHPLPSLNEAALSILPPLSSLTGLVCVRNTAEKSLPRFEPLPTVIRILDITPSNPGRAATPWRIHARSLPLHTTRFVLHIRYRGRADLRFAQLSPRFWTFPPALREIVLHIRPHPSGAIRSRGRADNGFEGWARLLGLARVLLAAAEVRVVLVGSEEWDPAWISWDQGEAGEETEEEEKEEEEEETFEGAWCAICVAILAKSGMCVADAGRRVRSQFTFLSEEAYRRHVGETAWRLETVGTFAELDEDEGCEGMG